MRATCQQKLNAYIVRNLLSEKCTVVTSIMFGINGVELMLNKKES